jgi:hypothetical protein
MYLLLHARLANGEVVLIFLHQISLYALIYSHNNSNFIAHIENPLHVEKGSLCLLFLAVQFEVESY